MPKPLPILALLALAACSGEANHLGNPLLWPVTGLATAAENATYNERRGRVEVFVKTNHSGLMGEIANGQTGPLLTEAMDLSSVPQAHRAARATQLQGDAGLYAGSPEALVVALMVYGG